MTPAAQIATVRRFNRAWTEVTELLDDSYLHSGLSLPEARLVYELNRRSPRTIVELRAELKLDAGYTTRLLDRLAERGLLLRTADPDDRRRQLVAITDAGCEVAAQLAARADAQVAELLDPLPGTDREALVAALDTVAAVLSRGAADSRPTGTAGGAAGRAAGGAAGRAAGGAAVHAARGTAGRAAGGAAVAGEQGAGGERGAWAGVRVARAGELGWVLTRHAQLYGEEYGWPGFELAVARIVADLLADPKSRVWVAERDGALLGSVAFCEDDAETARLRLLLVEPAARGQRLGVRLVDECVAHARAAGYRRMVLHTQDKLTAAKAIYAKAGFVLTHTSREDSLDPTGLAEHWTLTL